MRDEPETDLDSQLRGGQFLRVARTLREIEFDNHPSSMPPMMRCISHAWVLL